MPGKGEVMETAIESQKKMLTFMMWKVEKDKEPTFNLFSSNDLPRASKVAEMFCERNNLDLMGVTFFVE